MAALRLTILPTNRWDWFKAARWLLLLLFGFNAVCEAGDLSLDGYFKSFFWAYQPRSIEGSGFSQFPQSTMFQSTNRLRLNLLYQPNHWLELDAAYDIVPSIQSRGFSANTLLFGQINPLVYRAVDLDTRLYPSEGDSVGNFVLNQNLDRASATFRTKFADITIGRQAIAWGSARSVNPTDVLAPFTFETLDTEDRIGIDAARIRIPLGSLSEIDAGYVFGKDGKFSNSAFYGRTSFNLCNTDFSLLFMGFRENLLAGFDMAGAIGGAGLWFETAYVFVDALDDYAAGRKNNYMRASIGLDYSLNADNYSFLEYHFNGAGAATAGDYLRGFSKPAYMEGAVYLMGRHYLNPGFTYQITPLISLTTQSLINITDPSFFITPQAEYNIASDVYLGAGAFIGIGSGPVEEQGDQPIGLQSEFGSYPNIYFCSLRYYF